MDQIHKRFTVEQVKVLLQSYLQGTIARTEVEEVLQINKTRFFSLLKEYRRDPAAFSIAIAILLIVGETLRTQLFPENGRQNKLFSGLFIFLKLKPDLSPPSLSQAGMIFSQIVLLVRTNVWT